MDEVVDDATNDVVGEAVNEVKDQVRNEGQNEGQIDVRNPAQNAVAGSAGKRESPFRVAGHACRPDCGACCIAPSISSPIPGMPDGKPAGVRCVQLGDDLRCAIFGQPERPACCSGLQPQMDMCGTERDEALAWLTQLEVQTRPRNDATAPTPTA
ncbi:hypothetical protein GGD40_003395 [Paraburkholderia bryophila]|uniref:Uncharacterized protein n=1 Tax=Paraburkholderia bryophila TaxID=420952 RepID=A0A7Z0B6X7_9BURK|nr:hypothetical protein [Paraburkholderia bryophila]